MHNAITLELLLIALLNSNGKGNYFTKRRKAFDWLPFEEFSASLFLTLDKEIQKYDMKKYSLP